MIVNVRPAFFYTKPFDYNSSALWLIMIIIVFMVPQFIVRGFKD